jgi:hypothetical protein
MKIVTVVASLFLFFTLGCQSKEACLKKYQYDSVDEFMKAYSTVKDNDEALKLHSIAVKCGCEHEK